MSKYAIKNGIRGYSDFTPTTVTNMLDYTLPQDLGRVSYNPSSSHFRFFNNIGPETGANTSFKTAHYAGGDGTIPR